MDSHWLPRWLTLGANVAVLAGIVLVVVELNQNRDMMRAQTRHEMAMGIVGLLETPANNGQLADVLFRGQFGGKLSPVEWFQFQLRTNALFRYWEDVHYQYRVGLYDDIEFTRQRDAWRASLANSVLGKIYWCQVRSLYSPEFTAEMVGLLVDGCPSGATSMNDAELNEFATAYTAAWNSQDPARVAAFFADGGALFVNGSPSAGRTAITAVAREFMTAFPDLVLTLDKLEILPGSAIYHWTFAGTNSGPGGTGNAVRFSGYEEWTFGNDGLVAVSMGHFDADEYAHQLAHGVETGDG